MEAVSFDSAFMFKYSARSGTKAFKWGETVSESEKSRRLQVVIALQESHAAAINRAAVGTTVEVLVEGRAASRGLAGRQDGAVQDGVFPAVAGVGPGDVVASRDGSTAHTLVGTLVQ